MAKVSIIVPCKKIDSVVQRCLTRCLELYPSAELMVITDEVCPGFPAGKRNWAMQRATGDVFAFIDSDAYPAEGWLEKALFYLQVFPAVCGPGVLPPDAPFIEHVADQVHKWVFCPYRVTAKSARVVPWHPTFNLIVKKEVAPQFDNYLTGEDDRFCLAIKEGVFYHPEILVYHNRRGAFRPLWKQFGTYARHKGTFVALAYLAWITTIWTYITNWIKGFLNRRPN
jgi:glycosyltransferase involved in cell wall biosynthesis